MATSHKPELFDCCVDDFRNVPELGTPTEGLIAFCCRPDVCRVVTVCPPNG